ncbi:MAG: sigma factor-like helix-turn-helix DNA-binding protein, partial [Flavobacteriales bacterium]|nr:sigma factor-like helix-turn-helix DNA-binding protein [Flavobacteriales bacterium]
HKRCRTVNGSTNIDISIQPNALESLALDDLISVLKTMPESLYTILNLYIVDGFDHNEISGMLGISAELSRQRLSRAKRWVKERFEMEGNDWKSKRKAR